METNGAFTRENIKSVYEKKGFMVGFRDLEAGTEFPLHKHTAESYVFNLGGQYSLEFEDETVGL